MIFDIYVHNIRDYEHLRLMGMSVLQQSELKLRHGTNYGLMVALHVWSLGFVEYV